MAIASTSSKSRIIILVWSSFADLYIVALVQAFKSSHLTTDAHECATVPSRRDHDVRPCINLRTRTPLRAWSDVSNTSAPAVKVRLRRRDKQRGAPAKTLVRAPLFFFFF